MQCLQTLTKTRIELRQFFEGNTVLLEMGSVVTVSPRKMKKRQTGDGAKTSLARYVSLLH